MSYIINKTVNYNYSLLLNSLFYVSNFAIKYKQNNRMRFYYDNYSDIK